MSACMVEGCHRPLEARGFCHKHYLEWWTVTMTDTPVPEALAAQDAPAGTPAARPGGGCRRQSSRVCRVVATAPPSSRPRPSSPLPRQRCAGTTSHVRPVRPQSRAAVLPPLALAQPSGSVNMTLVGRYANARDALDATLDREGTEETTPLATSPWDGCGTEHDWDDD